jgi:hypothetical protein
MIKKSEFKEHVGVQLLKISSFLQAWSKFKSVKEEGPDTDLMISNIVIRCGKGDQLLTLNLDQPLPGSEDV